MNSANDLYLYCSEPHLEYYAYLISEENVSVDCWFEAGTDEIWRFCQFLILILPRSANTIRSTTITQDGRLHGSKWASIVSNSLTRAILKQSASAVDVRQVFWNWCMKSRNDAQFPSWTRIILAQNHVHIQMFRLKHTNIILITKQIP